MVILDVIDNEVVLSVTINTSTFTMRELGRENLDLEIYENVPMPRITQVDD